MKTETYSPIDQLANKAKAMFGNEDGTPTMLTFVVVLSGILSALFFWQFSKQVFAQVYPPIAIVLGLIVGLSPSEGAYFGWRKTRRNKQNLTSSQLYATKLGLITSVATSMFSTFALFVATVPFVPADIQAYSDWFVFVALSVPILLQFAIIAYYELNERSTIENFENAKLDALGFDAYIRFEMARKMAIIEASNNHLEQKIGAYADIHGADEIHRLLSGKSSKSVGQQNEDTGISKQPRYHMYVNGVPVSMSDELESLRESAEAMSATGATVSILDTTTDEYEKFAIPNVTSPNGLNGHG